MSDAPHRDAYDAFEGNSSIGNYTQNYGRMCALLDLLDLPGRGPKGSRVNQQRARIVRAAQHQLKVASLGACEIKRRRGRCSICKVKVPYRTLVNHVDNSLFARTLK
jgi:hypothetical protein